MRDIRTGSFKSIRMLVLLISLMLLPLLQSAAWGSTSATGTWTTTFRDGASTRTLILQLHQRADGKLLGYIPGGTAYAVVTGGSILGDRLHLELEFKDPKVTDIVVIDGTVRRNIIVGTAGNGAWTDHITLRRISDVLHERRFLFAKPAAGTGDPTGAVELSILTDDRGRFVSGGFVSETDCSLFACGGGVTSFSETGATITANLDTGGACPGTGSFTATFDSITKFYSGTFLFTNCIRTDSGALIGVKGTRTRTDHVSGILDALGRIADGLESRTAFTAPYPSISPLYLHSGKTAAELLDELNAEITAYGNIDVSLNRFRNIKTVPDPDTYPDVDTPVGADFHDVRTGVPASAIGMVTFRDADTGTGLPNDTNLKYFIQEAGAWVVIGNGEAACTSPLFSALPISETAISFLTPIGNFNPPSHTVPTDHTYFYLTPGTQLVSPGNLHIISIQRTTYLVSPFRQGLSDYQLDYGVCGSIHGRFGHVVTLTDSLAAHLTGGNCTTYSTADEQIQSCTFSVDIHVSAGEPLGTVVGATAFAFDFGLYDDSHVNYFINPSRVHSKTLHAVCAYDYFEPELRERLLSHIGNGAIVRTDEPRCGTMEIDVAGTAQGLWVMESNPVQQGSDESFFVSLALDTITPSTMQVLSVGPASLGSGLMKVTTQHTGRANRAFSEVGPDGLLYCYTGGASYQPYSYFVSLGGDGRLSIEKVDHGSGTSPCLNDPATWTFSSSRVMFIR